MVLSFGTIEILLKQAVNTLELRAFVRKAVAVEIGLANPLNEPVEFEVRLTGNGLLGEEVLGAKESGTYELLYSPLPAKKWDRSYLQIST